VRSELRIEKSSRYVNHRRPARVEDAIATKPLADLDADWGKGRLNGDGFVKVVYLTL